MIIGTIGTSLVVTESLKDPELGYYENSLSMRAVARLFQSLNEGMQLYGQSLRTTYHK